MIYELIPEGMIVADVGCDHAYLAIELIRNNKSPFVYAIDNKEGPLKQARSNILQANLSTRIELILSDGLDSFDKSADVLVIAGMGVDTAIHILENAQKKLPSFERIIIQVNKNIESFRRWLSEKNYQILDENICYEDFFYQAVVFTTTAKKSYSEADILLGPILSSRKSEVFHNYLLQEIEKMEFILSKRDDENVKEKLSIYKTFV